MTRAIDKPFLQVDLALPREPYFVAFAAALRDAMPSHQSGAWRSVARCCLLDVWAGFLELMPSGNPRDVTRDTIELWASWEGTPGAFAEAFYRFMCIGAEGEERIRGWEERYGRLAEKRAQAAARQRDKRLRDHADSRETVYPTTDVPLTQGTRKRTRHTPVTRDVRVTGDEQRSAFAPNSADVTPLRVKSKELRDTPLPPPDGGGISPPPPSAALDACGVTDPDMLARQRAFSAALDAAVADVPHDAARTAIRRLLDYTRAKPETWLSHVARMTKWTFGQGTSGMRKVSFDAIAEGIGELIDNDTGQPITSQVVLIFAEKAERRRQHGVAPSPVLATTTGALSPSEIFEARSYAAQGDPEWIAYCVEHGITLTPMEHATA